LVGNDLAADDDSVASFYVGFDFHGLAPVFVVLGFVSASIGH
jgi:hypothetical protein